MRKDVHNLVYPVDFSNFKDVTLVVETLQNFIKRKVPIQFGLVPQLGSMAATQQAETVYHLYNTYGLSATFEYLAKASHSVYIRGLG